MAGGRSRGPPRRRLPQGPPPGSPQPEHPHGGRAPRLRGAAGRAGRRSRAGRGGGGRGGAPASRARAGTAINARELQRAAEAPGAGLCTAAAGAGARGRRQPAPPGSAPVPAPRSCARRPPRRLPTLLPFRPECRLSLRGAWPAPRSRSARSRGGRGSRPAAGGARWPEDARRPVLPTGARCAPRRAVAARTIAASLGCAPAGTFTLER